MNLQVDPKIHEFLVDFGLTEREISLYLTLLKTGPNTIMNLARETGIKRSTTHNNVEELIKKGLVSQTNFGERRMVVAEDPGKLRLLMQQKKWTVQKMDESLNTVVSSILSLVPQSQLNKKVEIKYYEGVEGFRDVCNRSLDYAKDEILFISNPDQWRKVFTQEYDESVYIPLRLKKKIPVRTLLLKTDLGKKIGDKDKGLLRKTKFLPKGFEFDVTMIIYSGEISIMLSSEPYTAILISSEEIYKTFRNLFENLWKVSTEE